MSDRPPAPSRLRRWLRYAVFGSLLIAGSAVLASWLAVSQLIAATHRSIDQLPEGLPVEEVTFDTAGVGSIHGWFTTGDAARATVLLLHGARGDRTAMLSRVRFLHRAGYSTLSIDLPAHGESPGDVITFGYRESAAAHAAVAYCRKRRPGLPLAVIAESLGGAAALVGETPIAADAFVLEMVFPDLSRALSNRVNHYAWPWAAGVLTSMVTVQCAPRLGVGIDAIRPIEGIAKVTAPVLIAGGELDWKTPPADTRALFAAANEPKELWLVPGAEHRDLHAQAPQDYEARVLAFLARHLR